jgi:hypothetical protein
MASTIERYRLQLDRCGRAQLVKNPQPLTGIEKQSIEEREIRSMHEEIDSFSVEAE